MIGNRRENFPKFSGILAVDARFLEPKMTKNEAFNHFDSKNEHQASNATGYVAIRGPHMFGPPVFLLAASAVQTRPAKRLNTAFAIYSI